MALPKKQALQDWLSQAWNIISGRRLIAGHDDWLSGPRGEIGGIADRFIDSLAQSEQLSLERNHSETGLVDSFDSFPNLKNQLDPRILDFYQHTIEYEFDVWTEWKPLFSTLGCLVFHLFTRRVQQLNLPQNALDTAYGIRSEVIILRDSAGNRRYTIWYRRLKKTNDVIYSGVYSECTLPDGERCLKIIFPLPQGSATVIMRATCDASGNLELISRGKRYDDPGFYLLVEDSKGACWKNYIRSFHERIFVYVDGEGQLRADHSMNVWGMRAYTLHYRMQRRQRAALQ